MKKILSVTACAALLLATFACSKSDPEEGKILYNSKVELSSSSIEIMETETAFLIATCYGDAKEKVVEWSSSNRDIAIVSNSGKVTGKGSGKATITAKAGKWSAECEVTVSRYNSSVVPVVKIDISPAEVTIVETRSVSVTAKYLPDNATDQPAFIWSSSDESVATVKDGVIKAVSEGECEVKVEGGNHYAVCKVNVIPDNKPTTAITLSETTMKLALGKSKTLTYAFVPADHTDLPTVKWETSDARVATVDNGQVTGVGTGSATITASYGNVKATCSVTVKDYQISVVASMYKNFFKVNWQNTSDVNAMKTITVEFLMRAEKWRNDASNPVSSIFGIEGKWLIRIGDQGIGDANLQVAKASNWTSGYNFAETNRWYHVAVVQNCTSRTIKLYIDGVLVKSGTATDSSINLTADECYISRSYDNSRYLQGELAELRVWKVERTAAEIAANIYNYSGDTSNLAAYWKFNEGEGNVVHDYSGKGNDLTANADITWVPVELPE